MARGFSNNKFLETLYTALQNLLQQGVDSYAPDTMVTQKYACNGLVCRATNMLIADFEQLFASPSFRLHTKRVNRLTLAH